MTKKSFILFGFVLFAFGAASLHSCFYDREDLLYNTVSNCVDTVYTYDGRIKAIVDQNCATSACHSGPAPENDLGLETYADVKNSVETGLFLCSITWQSGCSQMPKNASKLDKCSILAIEKWKELGYPEN